MTTGSSRPTRRSPPICGRRHRARAVRDASRSAEASGRILARDAVADAAYPADDRSTMDGFAVRSADGARPRRIVGTIRMGAAPPAASAPGEAMRIPTGGVLPAGADAVIPIEDARRGTAAASCRREAPAARDYFTPRGDDMQPGDLVLRGRAPHRRPRSSSVLATLGVDRGRRCSAGRASPSSRPATSSSTPPPRPARGQVRDSNRWAIAGGLAALGCVPVHLPARRRRGRGVARRDRGRPRGRRRRRADRRIFGRRARPRAGGDRPPRARPASSSTACG